jgi:preprotein translocase subunit SecE
LRCLIFRINGRSSTGRAPVSKTVGCGFKSYRPCNVDKMEKITLYIKESYDELVNKVSWPTWANLQSTTMVVLISTIIITIIIFIMDIISKNLMEKVYELPTYF